MNITVRGFDTVYAEASQSGFDVTRIHDTREDDHLKVAGDTTQHYRRNGDGLELLYEAIAVERVKAYRTALCRCASGTTAHQKNSQVR